ncbi:MAG TPA: hypothetical protein VGC13_12510 [Longimicrobium sp.]|jgi:hypothetical protein|uniref:hypothetical protein n=1 Tax=Longimicrobium sp. TaxID=2029185 RepID=UPI002ED9EBF3
MNSNDPRIHAAPRADGAAGSGERRFARRIDCAPRERPALQAAPAPRDDAPAPPHGDAHR